MNDENINNRKESINRRKPSCIEDNLVDIISCPQCGQPFQCPHIFASDNSLCGECLNQVRYGGKRRYSQAGIGAHKVEIGSNMLAVASSWAHNEDDEDDAKNSNSDDVTARDVSPGFPEDEWDFQVNVSFCLITFF